MKKLVLVLISLVVGISVHAKDVKKSPKKDAKTMKAPPKGRVDPVPGGFRADHDLWKRWEGMIKAQSFPTLPKASELKYDDIDKPVQDRKRFIFYLDVDHIRTDLFYYDAEVDEYWRTTYTSKEQGTFMLVVHPKWKSCFDNLTKKFDQMQWVAFVQDKIEDPNGKGPTFPAIALEYPRQCTGALKTTGSKLPEAAGELGQ